jgi:Fe2+ transport system protein FeoA
MMNLLTAPTQTLLTIKDIQASRELTTALMLHGFIPNENLYINQRLPATPTLVTIRSVQLALGELESKSILVEVAL